MLKTLLKHSLRAFNRQKGYFLINIFGLSISIACSVIISLFVIHQLSWDNYNEKNDRLYRLILNGKIGGQEVDVTSIAAIVSPTIMEEFPEIEDFLRMNGRNAILHKGSQSFVENDIIEADSSFFNFFSIPLINGDPASVLNAPNTMVLSESKARTLFGDDDPVGQSLQFDTEETYYTITGVFKDIPPNTHFDADIIVSFMTNPRSNEQQWTSNSFSTYLLLKSNTTPEQVEAKFPDLIRKYVGPEIEQGFGWNMDEFFEQGNKYRYYLQPVKKIHLNPEIEQQFQPASSPKYLYIFGSIAILIIIIASINYMNLSTAQSTKRAREVGIKKMSGSSRALLIKQFLVESIFITLLALLIAIIIIELILPLFSNLINLQLEIGYFKNWYTIPGLLLTVLFVGFLAGSYPAFYLSHFKPIGVLKGNLRSGLKNKGLRSVLVVFQFTISIMLIIGSMIMYRQLYYILDQDLGFNKENLMVIQRVGALGSQGSTFKARIEQVPGVKSASLATAIPGRNNNNNGYNIEGRDEGFLMFTSWVDKDFWDTFEMEIVEGRGFDFSHATDTFACLLNETAVREFNLEDPLSTRVLLGGAPEGEGIVPVIGVVKDFHHESLHTPIYPYIFRFKTDAFQFGYLNVRLDPDRTQETIAEIKNLWKEFTNSDPLQYVFMDEDIERLYREEKQSTSLAIIFTILAILIASLGLFGLTSFTLAQRTREIGIRKTMGASVTRIFMLISKEISILVGIATLIAWPAIYFIAKNWLENFYYRINLKVIEFVIGFIIALLIAMLTISYRTLKSARANPANALKWE